MLVPEYIP